MVETESQRCQDLLQSENGLSLSCCQRLQCLHHRISAVTTLLNEFSFVWTFVIKALKQPCLRAVSIVVGELQGKEVGSMWKAESWDVGRKGWNREDQIGGRGTRAMEQVKVAWQRNKGQRQGKGVGSCGQHPTEHELCNWESLSIHVTSQRTKHKKMCFGDREVILNGRVSCYLTYCSCRSVQVR